MALSETAAQIVEFDDLTPQRQLSLDAVGKCVHYLRNRRLLILPTETGYMIAANALDNEAFRKVFREA